MLLKKGIVRKTFFFSSLLITLVILVSFAILYYMTPRYYFRWKEDSLKNNIATLAQKLSSTEDYDSGAALINIFCEANNVVLIAFDADENIIQELSTMFIGVRSFGYAINETAPAPIPGQMFIDRAVPEAGLTIQAGQDAGAVSIRRSIIGGNPQNYIALDSHIGTALVESILVRGALQPIDEASGVILSLLPYIFIAAIFLGLLLSGLYANRVSKPLLAISDAALKMQTMEPGIESGVRTDDELGRLSSNLDALYGKLLENVDELRAEISEVNRLERAKTEMLQGAGHELKTPVAALSGMLEGMIDNVGQYKNRDRYLRECRGQAERLAALVAEILEAATGDMHGQEPDMRPVDAGQSIENILNGYLFDIEAKNLEVEKNMRHINIMTAQGLFERVVSNLLSNAVRYTPQYGKISVNLTRAADGAAVLSIMNDCAGHIPDDDLIKMTEPFYTRTYSRDRGKSGTGLGLYIVRRSLESMGVPYRLDNTGDRFAFIMTFQESAPM